MRNGGGLITRVHAALFELGTKRAGAVGAVGEHHSARRLSPSSSPEAASASAVLPAVRPTAVTSPVSGSAQTWAL